ncbi:matrixin family metalloprotease [Hymenobacter chitinivorans]|uniref:Putative secreted protein (Por secretion system target) n=1 Tax=Hymenobacter chitinivorans DSM 11115 TaxID=1121954 RepID=A0A2M9BS91_9BACT|nr:matrixin family metalloprotease [Hymenobacter chitinivorans]PJJ60830.1 putative secreted protein (Por secretion system target) [Hymenobacter chitinivorans DSM 11115]
MKKTFLLQWLLAKNLWFCPLALGLLLGAGGARAQGVCLLQPVGLDVRARAAPLVVEASLGPQRVAQTGGHLYTFSQVTVHKVFAGPLPAGPVEIAEPGGTLGLQQERVSATAMLQPGEQGVFFLEPDPANPGLSVFRLYAGPQGFIRYQLPARSATEPFGRYPSIAADLYPALTRLTGQAFRRVQANPAVDSPAPARQPQAAPVVSGFGPQGLVAGNESVLTITGANFGATRGAGRVEFPNADTGGSTYVAANPSDYLLWSDTRIQVRVPSQIAAGGGTAGTGTFRVYNDGGEVGSSPAALVVVYALSTVVPTGGSTPGRPRLLNDDGQGGYTLRYSPGFTARPNAAQSFERALAAWTCATRLRRVVSGTAAPEATAQDNINAVRFGTAVEVPNGVLARTNSYYSGCSSNGIVSFSVIETDYTFNTGTNWQFGGPTRDPATGSQYDFESVALHELGHGQQLSHVIDPPAVMHFAIANGQNKRSLNPATDVVGGQDVLSFSTTNPCPSFAVPVLLPVATSCTAPLALAPATPVAGLALYPSPVENRLRVTGPSPAAAQLTFFDLAGRRVLSRTLAAGQAEVAVGELRPGWYLVEWNDGQQPRRGRMLKR